MGVHDDHRKRMRKRFIEHGLDNFDDHNVLELLLFYAIPQRDVNPLAHALMEKFGSLWAVLEADYEELVAVKGVGEYAAALLALIPQINRRYMISRDSGSTAALVNAEDSGKYFLPYFAHERDEVVYMACLDAGMRPTSCVELSRGVVNTVEVSVKKIVETALLKSAYAVILAHNHVSGIALPSREDELTTERINQALATVGIVLADHLIFADGDFVSLRDSGIISK